MRIETLLVWIWIPFQHAYSQVFSLEHINDSTYNLVLQTDSTTDKWALPYPVYQFQVGDIDGDGKQDAIVGVVKRTRFHPEKGRRLFIFKNKNSLIRPLWMGSKLGGILVDFKYVKDGVVRSLEKTLKDEYVVAEYKWQGFGLGFERFLIVKVSKEEATIIFNQ
ncbi:MAG: hypothetical protein J6W77_00945 [Prevotella sp.]|nr:hypothetical protein [Prevotella sp.]